MIWDEREEILIFEQYPFSKSWFYIFSIFAKKKVLSQIDLVIHQLSAGGVSEEIRVITYTKNVHEDVGFSKESTFPSKTSLSRGSQNPYEPFLIFRNFMKLGSGTSYTQYSRPNYGSGDN